MSIGGLDYATGQEITARWPDVGDDRLRDWVRTGKVAPLTVGQLAAATGLDVPAGIDPGSPARLPNPDGPAMNLYPWLVVVEVERDTSRSAQGGRHGPRRAARRPRGA